MATQTEQEATHTPGTISLRPSGLLATDEGNVRLIARVEPHGDDGTLTAKDSADGRRLAALWNASRGVPTTTVENPEANRLFAAQNIVSQILDVVASEWLESGDREAFVTWRQVWNDKLDAFAVKVMQGRGIVPPCAALNKE